MKPAPFKYFAPTEIDEALALLDEYGFDAKILAGGQSLVPTMNFRLAQPEVLVDLNRIDELSFITAAESGELRIGAMTRHREVERSALVAEKAPLLHEALPFIAHPQIRNRGTIGGSLAHADPAAELPAVMLALEAKFHLRTQNSERWLQAAEFFTGLFETALEPEEMLVEIAIPPQPKNRGWAFREVSRRHGDFALVGVAALIDLDSKKKCRNVRLTFLSVGEGPVMATEAVQALHGKKLDAATVQEAAEIAAGRDIDPPNDIHASAEYRRMLAKTLATQALQSAATRAKA